MRFAGMLAAVTAIALVGTALVGAQRLQRTNGDELYTPSKQEWACLTANALAGHQWSAEAPYRLEFAINGADPNSVLIRVSHSPTITDRQRELMAASIKEAHRSVADVAKQPGFEWLTAKEDVRPL